MTEPKRCEWCDLNACDCAERIACTRAGTACHWHCGWCQQCDKPGFECVDVRNHRHVAGRP